MLNKDLLMKLFLVSSVLGMAVSYQKIFLLHITFAFIAVVLVIPYLRKKSGFRLTKQPTYLHWLPVIMFFWYLVMTLFSHHIPHSLKYVFYVANGVGIVFVMVYYTENMGLQKKVFQALAWIFCIEIVISLLEMYTPFRMPLSPYSPILSFFGREFATSVDLKLFEHVPTGFHWNPNDLAVAVTLTLPFFLLSKKIIVKLLGSISIFIISLGADSRGCLITIFVVIVLYIVMYQRNLLKIIIPIVVLALAISPFYMDHIKKNPAYVKALDTYLSLKVFISQDDSSLDSIGLRQRLFRDGVQSIVQSKGLGIGPGENMYLHQKSTGEAYYAMHNYWMELCVDAGVLFGLLFMVWHWYMAFRLQRIARKVKDKDPTLSYYAKSTFLSLVGFYFSVISLSSASYFLPMWILYGFAIITIHNAKRLEIGTGEN